MLYVHVIRANGQIESAKIANERDESERRSAENRNHWHSMAEVQAIAVALDPKGDKYLAIDAGSHVSPRYDIIEMPKVGDKVSYAFNGDYYPCGEIKSVSKFPHRVIVTTEGQKFYRRGDSGAWKYNQTWSLVQGHISRTNPEF